jgi:hypothetical protein
MDIEQAARDNKLAELEILRQSLEDRDRRIWELEKKIDLLETMLNRMASVRVQYPQPAPQRLPDPRTTPRRWSVKS